MRFVGGFGPFGCRARRGPTMRIDARSPRGGQPIGVGYREIWNRSSIRVPEEGDARKPRRSARKPRRATTNSSGYARPPRAGRGPAPLARGRLRAKLDTDGDEAKPARNPGREKNVRAFRRLRQAPPASFRGASTPACSPGGKPWRPPPGRTDIGRGALPQNSSARLQHLSVTSSHRSRNQKIKLDKQLL